MKFTYYQSDGKSNGIIKGCIFDQPITITKFVGYGGSITFNEIVIIGCGGTTGNGSHNDSYNVLAAVAKEHYGKTEIGIMPYHCIRILEESPLQ